MLLPDTHEMRTLTRRVCALLYRSHFIIFSQSFEFLLAVSEFKKDLALDAAAAREKAGKESTTKVFGGFGGYLAVVNDHIKDGSFYEINIDSRNKRDIMKHANFKDYAMLDLVREPERERWVDEYP